MKIRTFLILLFVVFVLSCFLGRISLGTRWPERVDISFGLSMAILIAGGVIAAVSLFLLLQRGISGQPLHDNLLLVVVLLGGLLLYQANWGTALAVGMIGTAIALSPRGRGPKEPGGE